MGELSARMKVPGNLWIEVWSTAQPVPVRRQRRLFNDTREAEEVLLQKFKEMQYNILY